MASTAKRTLWIETFLQDKLSRPLTDVERKVARFGQKSLASLKDIGANQIKRIRSEVVQLGLVYAGFKGLQFAAGVAQDAAQLALLAETTGDSVRNLSELVNAMSLVGVSGGEATAVIRALGNATRQALQGNVEIGAAFEQLNISLEDLQRLAPSQLFERLVRALAGINSEQERQFRLGRILPEQYQALLPILGRGTAEFDRLIKKARAFGGSLSEEQAGASKAFQENLAAIRIAVDNVISTVTVRYGKDFSALLANVAKAFSDHAGTVADFVRLIGTGLVKAVDLSAAALIGFVKLIEKISGPLDGSKEKIAELKREMESLTLARQQGIPYSSELRTGKQLDDRIQQLKRQITDLAGSDGVAGAMAKLREELKQGLGDLGNSLGASPVTVDQAATIVGAPTSGVLDRLDVLIARAKKQQEELAAASQIPSRSRVLGSSGPALSVFQDNPTGTGAGFADGRETFKRQQQELEQLAALAPTLRPLQDRLLELKRDAAVFDLEHARTGAANAELIKEAIAKVNEEFEKSQRLVTGGDFFAGFNRGAREAIKEWTDFEKAGEHAAQQVIGGGLDNLTSELGAAIAGTKSWKEAWRDWAASVLGDLGRVAARLATIAILSAVGLADGGVVKGGTVPLTVRGAADGAIITRPTLLAVGEGKSSEAVVPMPHGKIPVELRGRGGGGNVTVNLTVQAWDRHDVQRVLLSNKDFLGQLIAQQVGSQAKLSQAITKART